MFSSIPLRRTGPYRQKEVNGFFGKTTGIPDVNPEDGSYMPTCASGPCAQYSYSYGPQGEPQSTCVRYSEPTTIPHKTNFFNSAKNKNRTSCGYNANPVGLFSGAEPTYYVYWEDQPIGGKKQKRKGIQTRKATKTNRNKQRGG